MERITMKEITRTFNVYQFSELSDTAKERAVQDYSETLDTEWFDYIIEHWQEKLASIGFINAEIYFSHFYSQGEGAGFISDIDTDLMCDALILCADSYQDAKWINAAREAFETGMLELTAITHHGHYYHANSYRFEQSNYLQDNAAGERIVQIFDDIEHVRYQLCEQIRIDLIKAYEYQTSEEQIEEISDINDWYYLEDGSFYYE